MTTSLKDSTVNQHFVLQTELRFSAINPNAHTRKQRIYQLKLLDREACTLKLTSDKGTPIKKSLSLNNLFSFDVLGEGAERYNFELLFHQYEADIKKNTDSLLQKITSSGNDITHEVINLFAAKLLNFFRNPYSIKKVLNTVPLLTNAHPTSPEMYKDYIKVRNGIKPHQKNICEKLAISESTYENWLSVIFLLLSNLEKDTPNIFEQSITHAFEDKNLYWMILVCIYDGNRCLISDRGYSTPLPEEEFSSWDFNLCSNAFIRYCATEIDKVVPQNAPQWLIERYKNREKISIETMVRKNDLVMLKKYHENLVYQCHEHVYSSSKECYGITTC